MEVIQIVVALREVMSCIKMAEITIRAETPDGIFEEIYNEVKDEYGMFMLTEENLIFRTQLFEKSKMELLEEENADLKKRLETIEKSLGLL